MTPRPFLKWVGGKGQLVDALLERVDRAGPFGRYFEPFVGGGALFFALRRRGWSGHATLMDVNPSLIAAYGGVQEHPRTVLDYLRRHEAAHKERGEAYFYEVRADGLDGCGNAPRAARVIFLNKTCFNGLWRENSLGAFNAAYGKYDAPAIVDEENLLACSQALRGVGLHCADFSRVMEWTMDGDIVYLDPPYLPVSPTANFTSYAGRPFRPNDHVWLARFMLACSHRGVRCLLSNSDVPAAHEIFSAFRIERVEARRSVNRVGSKRGPVGELLITNY